jgi:hypothetical protein
MTHQAGVTHPALVMMTHPQLASLIQACLTVGQHMAMTLRWGRLQVGSDSHATHY